MRKLFGSLLALALMMSGAMGVAAQDADADTAYGSGVGSPATWFDDRGNPLATVEVTEVVEDWSEYEENRGPARGYLYYGVAITVTNIGSDDMEVSARNFSLVDSMGLNIGRSNATAAADASVEVFTDTATVTAGESADFVIVYELFSDVSPAMLVWQADSGQLVLVNLGDGSLETSSVAQGLNMPATWSDDRGNEVATIEVVEVTDDWQDYVENRSPDRGSRYVAVTFSVTNNSDAAFELNPYNLSLVDTEGANNSTAFVSVAEGAETVLFSDRQDVAPGETVEGTLVYQMFTGIDPVGLIWQPEYGMLNFVILVDGAESTVDAEATPANGDDADSDINENDLEDLDGLATPAA